MQSGWPDLNRRPLRPEPGTQGYEEAVHERLRRSATPRPPRDTASDRVCRMLSAPIPLPNSDTAPVRRLRASRLDFGRETNSLSNTAGSRSPWAATLGDLRGWR